MSLLSPPAELVAASALTLLFPLSFIDPPRRESQPSLPCIAESSGTKRRLGLRLWYGATILPPKEWASEESLPSLISSLAVARSLTPSEVAMMLVAQKETDAEDRDRGLIEPWPPPATTVPKAPVVASPAISVEWQDNSVGLNAQSPPRILEGGLPIEPPLYFTESLGELQTHVKGRQGARPSSNSCWMLLLLTLNTLTVCWVFWQLKQRMEQMLHSQEAALGDLADVVKNRALQLHDLRAPLGSLSPPESFHDEVFYEWGAVDMEKEGSPPAVDPFKQEFAVAEGSPPLKQPGSLHRGPGTGTFIQRSRTYGHSAEFLLSPTKTSGRPHLGSQRVGLDELSDVGPQPQSSPSADSQLTE
ncbi:hypothetical protein cyc_00679 [Cyclospora cayetanensis]|uniref:Uncharacterized protein n=1 Tax=Cyclospora cayetanensis TaxID=88456 RepID=A0A1D3CR81_9EIME|nr:hypothetical protein cyc_00679 [Cyclospora cayetanensis]